jgi:hypothetical protein
MCSITLHYITLHYITLHYITLHYITLHYITLHYITYSIPTTVGAPFRSQQEAHRVKRHDRRSQMSSRELQLWAKSHTPVGLCCVLLTRPGWRR